MAASWVAASCPRTAVAQAKRAQLRKIAGVQFDCEARRSLRFWPWLDVLVAKWNSLHRISTCSALLRCVLRGLGDRGNPLCGEEPLPVTWFPVASRLRLHRASLFATVACADLQARYALLVPEPSVQLPLSP